MGGENPNPGNPEPDRPEAGVPYSTAETVLPSGPTPSAAAHGPAPTGLTLVSGARPLPEYELLQLLGKGGFGEVWRARGPGGFDVALKFVRLGDKAGDVEMRSLELMKHVRHANLLALVGSWQRDGHLIVAMELGDKTLLDRLREENEAGRPGIPREELLEYMREAAKGIDFLNEQQHQRADGTRGGIQHKDIKPQNLLLVGGSVKIADFGLAKLLEQTQASMSGGMTPAYAAPEFLNGKATRWSDQYCLAASYCQLRGGRLPFMGPPMQIITGHLMHQPDLTMLPAEEQPVVARALAKEPAERWPNCREFVAQLATTGVRPPTPPAPQPTPPVPPPASTDSVPTSPEPPPAPAERELRTKESAHVTVGTIVGAFGGCLLCIALGALFWSTGAAVVGGIAGWLLGAGAGALVGRALEPRSSKQFRRLRKAVALSGAGNYVSARAVLRSLLEEVPQSPTVLNNLAWLEATCPDDHVRDGAAAVAHARRACELSGWKVAAYLDTLAAACAEAGDFVEAVRQQELALSLAPRKKQYDYGRRLDGYRKGQKYQPEDDSDDEGE